MAVFRVERNKGYTVMNNHHLRNKELTLKAKRLLSQMLLFPENWGCALAGLSQITRESVDAILAYAVELTGTKDNFILPEICKPCLPLCSFQFAQLIVLYPNKLRFIRLSGWDSDM